MKLLKYIKMELRVCTYMYCIIIMIVVNWMRINKYGGCIKEQYVFHPCIQLHQLKEILILNKTCTNLNNI